MASVGRGGVPRMPSSALYPPKSAGVSGLGEGVALGKAGYRQPAEAAAGDVRRVGGPPLSIRLKRSSNRAHVAAKG